MAFNKLTDAQAERLAILAEECAEVIHMIGKTLRHGYEDSHPDYDNITNRKNLEKELGNVGYIIHEMIAKGDINETNISLSMINKGETVKPFLHHQHEDERLEEYKVLGSKWKPN